MRKLIFPFIVLLGLFFVYTNLGDVEAVAAYMAQGNWRFLLVAILAQFAWLLGVAATYSSIFRLVGIQQKLSELLLQSNAAFFMNTVAPSGGVGGVSVFISQSQRNGYSAARVTLVGVLWVLFDYASFLVFLMVGFIVLIRRDNLHQAEIGAAVMCFAVALFLALVLYTGMRSEAALLKLLITSARAVNRLMRLFIRREYVSEQRAYSFAHEAVQGLQEIRQNPKKLIWPMIMGLSSKASMLAIFYFCFRAFYVPTSTGTVIAGFTLAYLFTLITPTPSGIGIVEGLLPLTLASMFVPIGSAAAIVFMYRGITFWMPLAYGFTAFRFLGKRS